MANKIIAAAASFGRTVLRWLFGVGGAIARSFASLGRWAKRRPRIATLLALALLGLYSVALVGVGAIGGVWAERSDLAFRLNRRFHVESRLNDVAVALGMRRRGEETAEWREVPLNQHSIEWASVRVRPAGPRGGALVEVNGHIVFASPLGRFNYLSAQNRFGSIDLRAPTRLAELVRSPVVDNPRFMGVSDLRVHDLQARQVGAGEWELYASMSRFGGENCFQFVVARTRLHATAEAVSAPSREWEDVYVARPGCIRYKDQQRLFEFWQSGGRMEFLDPNTMLVSVGDHQFDGFNDSFGASMDPDWDLGKIIALNLQTGAPRIYAQGLRNPQGLVVMRDGRIFETEHGPQGGDEINFIGAGENYGWPLVTYGMNYGFPRRVWGSDPAPGGHGGYRRPAYAFVPSIGISNLVQPNAEEFPLWANNDLLLGSLTASMLYHVFVDGEEVAYVEPLQLDLGVFGRDRYRDLISMRDGRIVILTDGGRLIFIRNADLHRGEPREFVVTGYDEQSEPLAEESPPDLGSPAENGRQAFAMACASCHSLSGEVGIGPPLNGVVGRRIGSVEGFGYSDALADHDGVWTEDMLRAFITDPQQRFPGTTMATPDLPWGDAPFIATYLETTRGAEGERGGTER